MRLKATLGGMKNYNGVACTFVFENSAALLPEEMTREHFKIRQLEALFPGTVIEDVEVDESGAIVEPKPHGQPEAGVGEGGSPKDPDEVEVPKDEDAEAEDAEAEAFVDEDVVEEEEEPRETETIDAEDVGDAADVLGGDLVEKTESDDEEEEEEEDLPEASEVDNLIHNNSKDELQVLADAKGIEYTSKTTKLELADAIAGAQNDG